MYTILVNDENELYGSHKERIMHRSNCVDTLVFIVNPIYKNTHDMTNASVLLEYVLPVSKRYKTEFLELSTERYNDCFLQYKLPFNTALTSEVGDIELSLTFAYVEMNANGDMIQRVRKTSPTTIKILPVSTWADFIPDEALSSLDQRILKLDSQMRGLNDYAETLNTNKADNLMYDNNSDTLQLTANGKGIGDKISVRGMLSDGIPVVNFGSNNGSNEGDCDCGCDCEDNVVEFGGCDCGCDCENDVVEFGYSNVEKPELPDEDEDNVTLF